MCWTPPTLWRGRLFLRNHHRAVCVYLGPPETLTAAQRAQATTAAHLPATRSWNWLWLIGREPDFPNDAPSWQELTTWYSVSLGVWLAAALIAAAAGGTLRVASVARAATTSDILFWLGAFILGLAATALSAAIKDNTHSAHRDRGQHRAHPSPRERSRRRKRA
ncbi:MAG: hypothetical protein L0Y71_07105 [Gemmataceae bacterium]|nr:hypothetical protein [Gemmataceae bacterium]